MYGWSQCFCLLVAVRIWFFFDPLCLAYKAGQLEVTLVDALLQLQCQNCFLCDELLLDDEDPFDPGFLITIFIHC